MATFKRQATRFASLWVGRLAAAAGAWLLMLGSAASAPLADQLKSKPAPHSATLGPVQRTPCPLQPAAAVGGRKDAQFVLQTDLSSMTASTIASFIVVGKEAVASDRPRDAEVAFLMACRVADKLRGMDSTESADARYQLGWLYAQLALEDGSASTQRTELRRRAERLYADSLQTYQAKHGPAHEKTRFAAEGLAALSQSQSQAPSPVPERRPTPSQAPVPAAQPRQETAALPTPPGPSFDCAKARSVVENMICADAELARLDRELGRLYARAKTVAADNAAFRRQTSEEWRRREATCRDRECLVRWYAYRLDQLVNSMQQQEPSPSAVSR